LNKFAEDEFIPDFLCPSCNSKTIAKKNNRFATFPSTLAIMARRFVFDDWVPRKLAVQMDVPFEIDLDFLRGKGLQQNEKSLPTSGTTKAKAPAIDPEVVTSIVNMGFTKIQAEKAIFKTDNKGSEVALNWLFEHIEDADINDPLPVQSEPKVSSPDDDLPADLIEQLVSMGFSVNAAKRALKETQKNADRAVDWLFNHAEDPSINDEIKQAPEEVKTETKRDNNPAHFELSAFVLHLGSSTGVGHYVAYIKSGKEWLQYNDRKVSIVPESNLPIGNSYLLFWRRKK